MANIIFEEEIFIPFVSSKNILDEDALSAILNSKGLVYDPALTTITERTLSIGVQYTTNIENSPYKTAELSIDVGSNAYISENTITGALFSKKIEASLSQLNNMFFTGKAIFSSYISFLKRNGFVIKILSPILRGNETNYPKPRYGQYYFLNEHDDSLLSSLDSETLSGLDLV